MIHYYKTKRDKHNTGRKRQTGRLPVIITPYTGEKTSPIDPNTMCVEPFKKIGSINHEYVHSCAPFLLVFALKVFSLFLVQSLISVEWGQTFGGRGCAER